MLGKLLKYDFRALSRIMLPLQGGAILVALMGVLFLKLAVDGLSSSYNSSYYYAGSLAPLQDVLMATSFMLAGFSIVVMAATSMVTLILIGRHYYKSLLRDEGYLAFTLPVTANKHLLSKVMAGTVWLLINAVIIMLGVALLIEITFASTGMNMSVFGAIAEAFRDLQTLPLLVLTTELLLFGLIMLIAAALQVYVALTIGAVIAKTHKVLAGIGMYVAIHMIISTINTMITFSIGLGSDSFYSYSTISWFYEVQWAILPSMIIYSVFAVVFYLICKHLLQTKLNLD
jgi:hypothetical protein